MDSLDACLDRVDTAVQFREHSASGMTAPDELSGLGNRHLGDQAVRIIRILIDALDVGQKYQFLCLHRFRDRAGRIIRIDIVGIVSVIRSNRTDDRYKACVKEGVQQCGVHRSHFPYKADICAVRLLSGNTQDGSVLAGDTAGFHACFFHHGYQPFIDPVQHHLSHVHGLIVGHAESVDEFALFSDLPEPSGDLLAAAMDDDRSESDQFEKGNIFNYALFQFMIHHGASAIFHDDRRPLKSLDIRKRFDQHPGFIQIHFHFPCIHLMFHITSPLYER